MPNFAKLATPTVDPATDSAVQLGSNAWMGVAEFAQVRDLNIDQCPTCLRESPENFFMFRPVGLEYWRCLACLARTSHGGALFVARSGDGGANYDDDPAPY
jgi:hypothetical protein